LSATREGESFVAKNHGRLVGNLLPTVRKDGHNISLYRWPPFLSQNL